MTTLELNTENEHTDRETRFAEVILPLALPKTFTYRVPYDLNETVAVGKRVTVQFGKKKMYSAIVHSLHSQPPVGYEAKYLHAVIDDQPVVKVQQLQLWEWMASYYLCTLGEVMNAALPAGLKLESESKIYLNREVKPDYAALNEKEYLVIEALEKNHELTISQISEIIQQKHVHNLIKDLISENLILIHEELRDLYKPKTVTCVQLNPEYKGEEAMQALFDKLGKAPKQLDLLMAWVSISFQKGRITKKELLDQARSSDAALKALTEKKILELYAVDEEAFKQAPVMDIRFDLNDEQQKALGNIEKYFADRQVVLMHGVTSSGKTHVYVKLMEQYVRSGRQVLYLLPEIALTSHIIMRLRRYFGDHIVTFHSRLSSRERMENWFRVASGKAQIVLGPRSALFMPFDKLGLIIVDEEHEASFKQQDPAPRYHARDTAIYLAGLNKAKVLLGSATPSFESYFNASNGKYGLVELFSRFGAPEMPEIEITDIAADKKHKTMHAMFGEKLLNQTAETIKAGGQVILFQNRRGYAPMLECAVCAWIPKCVNCDIHLTYHKLSHKMRCHYCGYSEVPATKCKQCASTQLSMVGFGTERVEDELSLLLPEARILRLDLDAVKTKNSHADILSDFESHKADVLVGTQMISKGLDFEKVHLVGIINADSLLNFPDFRAHEKAFQLMEQVAGRAGRRENRGTVLIQSHNPGHKVLQWVATHDYQRLFLEEMQERQQFHYPPYTRLVQLTLRHKEEETVQQAAFELGRWLREKLGSLVIGPEQPYVGRVKNLYLQQLLLKLDREKVSPAKVKDLIRELSDRLKADKRFKNIQVVPDVDPF